MPGENGASGLNLRTQPRSIEMNSNAPAGAEDDNSAIIEEVTETMSSVNFTQESNIEEENIRKTLFGTNDNSTT